MFVNKEKERIISKLLSCWEKTSVNAWGQHVIITCRNPSKVISHCTVTQMHTLATGDLRGNFHIKDLNFCHYEESIPRRSRLIGLDGRNLYTFHFISLPGFFFSSYVSEDRFKTAK